METIINQITASQGLSAVAVLTLFNLLFIIIYAFFIGRLLDRTSALNERIDNSFDLIAENREQLELLKRSHSELNQSIPKISKLLHEDFSHVLGERDKRVSEIEQELSKAIERGKVTGEKINQRFETLEGVYSEVKGLVNITEPASANIYVEGRNIKEIGTQFSPDLFEKPKFKKATTKRPKFKAGDKVKTNTGSFYGVVVDSVFKNKKFVYLVSHKSKGSQRWFSETTLRFQ